MFFADLKIDYMALLHQELFGYRLDIVMFFTDLKIDYMAFITPVIVWVQVGFRDVLC